MLPSLAALINVPKRPVAGLQWGQTTRLGGSSAGGYASFNLAHHVGESPAVTAENWQVLAKAGGPSRNQIATCHQVHGDRVLVADTGGHHAAEADAVIAISGGGYGVGVYTADCVPILMVHPASCILAAAHCGWRGAEVGLAGKTLAEVCKLSGARPAEVVIWLGPSIAQMSYEVGPEVAERFDARFSRKHTDGKLLLDVAGAVVGDLLANGAREEMVGRSPVDTYVAESRCYSYRRDGSPTGRMLTYAWWNGGLK